MEINFALLVIAALAGMIIKLMVGWNPKQLVEYLSGTLILLLFLPAVVDLAIERDPQVIEAMTNKLVDQLIAEIPSAIIGEVAGVVAGTILGFATSLFRLR